MLKKIFLWLALFASILWASSFVFGYSLIFSNEITLDQKLSSNIYLDSDEINNTVLGFSSSSNISEYEVYSNCTTSSEFLNSYKSVYYFQVSFLEDCKNQTIILKQGENIYLTTSTKLNFVSKGDLFNILTDYSTPDLESFQKSLKKDIISTSLYKNYDKKDIGKNYK